MINSLLDKLKFYQDQTEIRPVDSPPPYGQENSAFVYPSSESDRTNDSAWASFSMSEADSLSLSCTQPEDLAYLMSPDMLVSPSFPPHMPTTTSSPAVSSEF